MRFNSSLLAVLVLASLAGPAPLLADGDTIWTRRYTGAGGLDSAVAIAVDASGNIYVTGTSDTLGQLDIVTLKYDTGGSLIWQARYDGPDGLDDVPSAIAIVPGTTKGGGTVHVTGSSQGSGGFDVDNWDIVTLAYRSDSGTLAWSARFDPYDSLNETGAGLALDSAGNSYVAGTADRQGTSYTDIVTICYDTAGSTSWTGRFSRSDSLNNAAAAIAWGPGATKGGGTVHVTGSSQGSGGDAVNWDYATLSYSTDSTLLWAEFLDGTGRDDRATAIAVDPGVPGGAVVTGASENSGGTLDYLTVAHDSAGDTLWVRRYDGGYGDDSATAIAVLPSSTKGGGTVHVTGSSQGSGGKSIGLDYLTIAYSASGSTDWTARYDGGYGDDIARAIAVRSTGTDGGGTVHVTGSSQGSGGKGIGLDYYTIVYNVSGTALWSHRYDGGYGDDAAVAIAVDGAGSTCVTGFSRGSDTTLDYLTIKYGAATRTGRGWAEGASLPDGSRPVGSGAWLALDAADGTIFATRGSKVPDFLKFVPATGSWSALEPVPLTEGSRSKPPYQGSAGVWDGARAIYATKGNSTMGFWRYSIDRDSWARMADVPVGADRKKVKAGTDLVCVRRGTPPADTAWLYLLKGGSNVFYRYSVAANRWDSTLVPAPSNYGTKYSAGSFLVYDGQGSIYAHQGKYASTTNHYMFRYDIATGNWTDFLPGMPLYGREGGRESRKKKCGDGASGAWYDGRIYALKGGNTQGFFSYDPGDSAWAQLDTIPRYGATHRMRGVKAGGDIASYGGGAFYVLKGNKTNELWRYAVDSAYVTADARTGGAATAAAVGAEPFFDVTPCALRSGTATLRLNRYLPGPAELRVYDVIGRTVLSRRLVLRANVTTVDLSGLSAGAYALQLRTRDRSATRRIVVLR